MDSEGLGGRTAPVIHAVPLGTHVYEATSLETGERALVVSTPIKRRAGSRWNWLRGEFVTIPTVPPGHFCSFPGCLKWRQWKCGGLCRAHFLTVGHAHGDIGERQLP